ncbi:MAG: DUF6067 family protein [Armatimonadetes bacterium]|nr:DUF6067 family protein [Armatimonadota bacterium]
MGWERKGLSTMRFVSLSVLLLTIFGFSVAQELSVFQVAPPPIADGQIGDIAWDKALTLQLPHRLGNGSPQAKTTVKFCFGAEHIFVLFVCDEPNLEAMKRNIKQHDGEVWTDDCVEVFLTPEPSEPARYYHIVVNSLGTVRDEFWQKGKEDVGWDSKARVGVSVGSDRWVAEIAIPIRSLNRMPIFSDVWLVNFARQRYSVFPPELSTWQPCKVSFHEPQNFGELKLANFTSLTAARQISAVVVNQEASKLQNLLRAWRQKLPTKLRTSTGKSVAYAIADWQSKLSVKDLAKLWEQVKSLQEKLPQLEAKVMQASVAEQVGKPYAVFAVSPMLKLRPEQVPSGEPVSSRNPVTLFAAKGEGESVQIVVAALEKSLKNVKVGVSPLVGPRGALILPEVRLVGYVPVQKPTPGGFGIAGRYPDPLLPLREFYVPEGECRSVWLTVWVPRDAEAGDYEGAITVEPESDERTSVPIRLRVYDVTLPTQSFLKTCVLIWDYKARQVYGDAWTPDRSRRFYELCLRYRFTPPPPLPWDKVFVKQTDGTWTANWDEFDREVEAWMKKGVTAFSIWSVLHWGTNLPPESERADVAAKLRLLGEHLKRKGWSERFYFYVFDEPSTSEFINIEALCRFVHENAPNLNILLTAGYGATGPFRTHAPTPDGAAYRALKGFINIWVPHIDCFDEPFLRERKEAGDQVWMYVCISTVGKTYPDIWRIDWTGVAHRAVGWWLWRYNCDGFLYWCVNYWTDDKGQPFDLFANPVAYPGGNGDGFLFYPDPQKGDPIPSVRAEIFRDGIEDYDLLTMLVQFAKSFKRNGQISAKFAKLLKQAEQLLDASNLIVAPNKFVDDPIAYEQRHRQILNLLEQTQKAQP